ncbi:VOC family protein [Leuconostoc gelidum subsp. aenigmaticum]|uniref:VOC family protein n=1 Tax=Leuconostoc gelidum TaxID=1244 RepID=UPI001CC5051A|nr:VOC family protein [Leuconostoc gelidum]MBZ6002810.1 VOC family protein [Leuconostoc gelidum subsp. aenigmaticum]
MKAVIPFLTFQTESKDVMDYYVTIFPNTRVVSSVSYPDQPELLMNGQLKLNGLDLYFLDMGSGDKVPIEWGISLYSEMESEEEFYKVFNPIAKDGVIIMGPMPIGDYKLATWVTDKFGVTWQFTYK